MIGRLTEARSTIRDWASLLGPLQVFALVLFSSAFIGFLPQLFLSVWTPRFAVVVAAIPAGLYVLARLAFARDRSAIVLGLLLVGGVFSALLSEAPRESFLGSWGTNTSLLIFVGVGGLWSLGRTLDASARRALPWVVYALMSLNILLGALQVALEVTSGRLATLPGRASGLFGNPVYFAALCAGTAALACVDYAQRGGTHRLAALATATAGVALSGSRVAAGSFLIILLVLVVTDRRVRTMVRLLPTAAFGFIVGTAVVRTAGARGADVVSRLGATSSGGRSFIWRYAGQAWLDHPLLGAGLGNHSAATRPYYSMEFTRRFARDERLLSWPDPHNAVLHLGVALGVVGVVLALLFVVFSARGIDDWPIAAFAAGIAITWSLQPMAIYTFPIAMFALGAAARQPTVLDGAWSAKPANEERDGRELRVRRAISGLLVVSIVLGMYVLVADYRMQRALLARDLSASEQRVTWFLGDPVMLGEVGRLSLDRFYEGEGEPGEVIRWFERAVDSAPNNAWFWAELGRRQLAVGLPDDAKRSSDRAIELHPWSPTGWQVRLAWAVVARDEPVFERAHEVVCSLGLDLCDAEFG